jgi:hypothetical protein
MKKMTSQLRERVSIKKMGSPPEPVFINNSASALPLEDYQKFGHPKVVIFFISFGCLIPKI